MITISAFYLEMGIKGFSEKLNLFIIFIYWLFIQTEETCPITFFLYVRDIYAFMHVL